MIFRIKIDSLNEAKLPQGWEFAQNLFNSVPVEDANELKDFLRNDYNNLHLNV